MRGYRSFVSLARVTRSVSQATLAGWFLYARSQLNEAETRAIARDEIASLCGLILRRLQEEHPSRLGERNIAEAVLDEQLGAIFGEALQQFGTDE